MARWARTTITTTVAAGLGVALALPASASSIPVGERCDPVSYAWSGEAVVGGDAPTVPLDLEVPAAVPGETVRVEAVLLDGDATVSVGGVVVDGGGDEIVGGIVALHHDGDPVAVSSLTLDVVRCALVAQAPPRSTPTQSGGAPSAQPGAVVAQPAAELPSTGAPTLGLVAAALACFVAGSALVAGARRTA
jgi:hypothetical protein